jgi:NAD(P) transhydrogenase
VTASGVVRIRDEMASAHARRSKSCLLPELTVAQCWGLISDTDHAKRWENEPRVVYQQVPVRPGLALRQARTVQDNPMVYEEEPYEWEEGRWYSSRWRFLEGPMAKFMLLFTFDEVGGQTRLSLDVSIWVHNPEDRGVAEGVADGVIRDYLDKTPARIVWDADPRAPRLLLTVQAQLDEAQLKAMERALLEYGESAPAVERLVRTIATRPDHELTALEPRALADRWRIDRDHVVDLFLRATRLKLLEPQWSVLCPSCRGPKGATADVALTAGGAHCDDCNITFEADPTTNLQLAFRPAPSVRKLDVDWFCMSGPARTPHVKAQAFALPGARTILTGAGAAGWRLRCPLRGTTAEVDCEHRVWRLDEQEGFVPTSESSEPLVIVNETSERLRVLVEDAALPDSVLRASEALAAPRFRELFRADQWEFLAAMERSWRATFDVSEPGPRQAAPPEPYDLVVVGSGPGGEAAALRAAQLGRRVAVVEARPTFGGPSGLGSKAFREAALKVLDWARDTSADRERLKAMFEERFSHVRRYVVALQSHELMRRLGRARVDLFYGRASLGAAGTVTVARPAGESALTLRASHLILATGSRPARPASIPFDGALVLDADDMNELARLPRRMCIIGCGVIGCEYASLLAALGVEVVAIHSRGPLLPMLDPEVAKAFSAELEAKGGRIVAGAAVARVETEPGAADPVRVHLEGGQIVAADQLLYVQGRDPATAGLGLDGAGIALGKYGRIDVDATGRTSRPEVLAVGDVVGPPGLASAAVQQGRAAADLLFGKGAGGRTEEAPQATALWTLPEVAGVGLTEAEAEARGLDFVCGYGRFRDLPRGLMAGDLRGWAKLIVERGSLRVVGAHVIGGTACDLIQHAVTLIRDGKTAADVADSGFSAVTFHNLYELAAQDALERA